VKSLDGRLRQLETGGRSVRWTASRGETRHALEQKSFAARSRMRYHEAHGHLNDEYLLTRDVIRLYHIQDKLAKSVWGIIRQVFDYPHSLTAASPPRVRDRGEIERGVMRAIFEDDPAGMSDLLAQELDARWRAAFEAEEELVKRLRSIPPAEHARLVAGLLDSDERISEDANRHFEHEHGISEEAFERALGPTQEYVDALTDKKYAQRCDEIYLRFLVSEEGYAARLALEELVRRHPEIRERMDQFRQRKQVVDER
jgi:hypothetical protein